MYEELAIEQTVRVPRPFAAFSSARVITTEYLRGTPFSDLIRFARRGEFGQFERLGLNRDLLAVRLIENSLYQIFRLRFFHADLHPGNLIALEGNVVGLIDFGLTDVLDVTVQEVQSEYLTALYNNDTHGMYRALSQIFVAGPNTDPEAFRRAFFEETNRWLIRLEDRAANDELRSATASYMITLMQLARSHDMSPTHSVLSMYRTLLTSESVAYHLRTDANLRDVGQQFFNDLQIEKLISSFHPNRAAAWLMQLQELARSGPSHVHQLLSDLAEGRFVLSVQSRESDQMRQQANRRTRLLALAVLSVSLALLLAATSVKAGPWDNWLIPTLWFLLFGVFVSMAFLWRKLR